MTTISIRLPDELLQEVERCARELHLPRTEYIRRAIQAMNQTMLQESRRQRLFEASRKVRENSMRVNAEFAAIEDEPDV
jgi:metal-responsive CopG/Arc/MetJ family transcriptional regulator